MLDTAPATGLPCVEGPALVGAQPALGSRSSCEDGTYALEATTGGMRGGVAVVLRTTKGHRCNAHPVTAIGPRRRQRVRRAPAGRY